MEMQALAISIAPIYVGEKLKMYQEAGDQSQKNWDNTPEDEKLLIIQQVLYVLTHPSYDASAVHANLVRQKRAAGWVLGPVFSKEDRTDPELMDYSQLPQIRRDRDALFVATVKKYAPQPSTPTPESES